MFPRTVVGRRAPWTVSLFCVSLAVLIGRGDAPAAERYAFLVGVKQYDKSQLNDLQFSENDVTRLSTILQASGYAKRNLVLMTQSVGAGSARLAPFAKNIQRELALVLRESRRATPCWWRSPGTACSWPATPSPTSVRLTPIFRTAPA